MKKLLAILLAVLLLTSLAACGDKSSDDKADATEKVSNKKYATVQEYYEDPANSAGFDSIKGSYEDVMDTDVRVEDGAIIYEFTLLTTLDEDSIPSVRESLEQVLDTGKASYKMLLETMQKDIDEDVSLKIIYRNGDGTVISEKTYTP